LPGIQRAQSGTSEESQKIRDHFSEAQVFARRHQFARANELLDQVEELLSHTSTAPTHEEAHAFAERLRGLVPQVQRAKAGNSPQGQTINLRFSEAQTFARKNRLAQANALLDQVEELLGQGLGTQQQPTQQTAPEPQTEPVDEERELRHRVREVRALVDSLKESHPARYTELHQKLTAARGSLDAGDPETATQVLNEIETEVHRVDGQSPEIPEAPEPPEMPETTQRPETSESPRDPDTGRLLDIWQQAKDTLNDQVSRLQSALRGRNNPDLLVIADKGLNGFTRRLQVGLQVALMNYDSVQGDARAQAKSRVLALVAEWRQFLQGDRFIQLIERNPFGVSVTIRATLGAALDRIGQQSNA
jgi:hypothetical protein